MTQKDLPMTELVNIPAEVSPMATYQALALAGIDVEKIQPLLAAADQWNRMDAEKRFAAALTKFQKLCPVVKKSRTAKSSGSFAGYTFAGYDDVMSTIRPSLDECEIGLDFTADEPAPNRLRITVCVRHGTHSIERTLTVPVPEMKVNDTQRYGAALSYAKRYALCAALNIVVSDEDNDAAALHESISDADANALEQLLMESQSDIPRFLKAYQIDKLEDLPATQLAQARAQVLRKMEQAKNARS